MIGLTPRKSTTCVKSKFWGISRSITHNTFDTISWNGVAFNGAGGYTIQNNVFKNTCDNGIQFAYWSVSSPTGSVVISNNRFEGNTSVGCQTGNGASGSAIGIASIAGASASVPMQITDNVFVSNERGLRVHDNYGTCNLTGKSLTISGNTVATSNTVGIHLDCVGQLNVSDNYWGSLTGPTAAGNPGGTGASIYIDPANSDESLGTVGGPGTIRLDTYKQYAP